MTWSPSVKQLAIMSQGKSAPFPHVCEWQDVVYLPANTAESFNVTTFLTNAGLPANLPFFLIIAADGPFWMHAHGTAAIPSSSSQGSTDGAAPDFSPAQVYIDGSVTSLSFIASSITCIVLKAFKT